MRFKKETNESTVMTKAKKYVLTDLYEQDRPKPTLGPLLGTFTEAHRYAIVNKNYR